MGHQTPHKIMAPRRLYGKPEMFPGACLRVITLGRSGDGMRNGDRWYECGWKRMGELRGILIALRLVPLITGISYSNVSQSTAEWLLLSADK